jgi:(5-formylfuran-3-yl)methyl phosphate synthase
MRLMISVVSAQEAREALSGGAILLDVKNPAEGSLGAQLPRVIREIKSVASGDTQISAAIGDMPNLPGTAALAALGAAVCGAHYIKVGLHGQRSEAEAIALMRAVKDAVREYHTSVIAAGYADYHRIGALSPDCLPRVAQEAGVQGCLIDTAIKDGNTLFDYMTAAELTALAQNAHAKGLLFGAAGALGKQQLPILRDAGIDVAGLRTAVCRHGKRTGILDPARVRNLLDAFNS